MQILKDDVKKSILESATAEFYSKGYSSASMRIIAKNASITVGNLYRYFKSKEEIFDAVVSPFYTELISYLAHEERSVLHTDTGELLEEMSEELKPFLELLSKNRKVMLIVFRNSDKTKYAALKIDFIKHISEHMKDHMRVEKISLSDKRYTHLPTSLAVSFFEGLLTLIETEEDAEILYKNVSSFLAVIILGTIELLKHDKKL